MRRTEIKLTQKHKLWKPKQPKPTKQANNNSTTKSRSKNKRLWLCRDMGGRGGRESQDCSLRMSDGGQRWVLQEAGFSRGLGCGRSVSDWLTLGGCTGPTEPFPGTRLDQGLEMVSGGIDIESVEFLEAKAGLVQGSNIRLEGGCWWQHRWLTTDSVVCWGSSQFSCREG